MLSVNKERINENIKLGYYDTLKILKKYDGYNFIFKKHYKLVYNILLKGVDADLVKKVKRYFKATDDKEIIIKSLEYVMLKEKETYFQVYNVFKELRKIRKIKKNNFIYDFVKELRIL